MSESNVTIGRSKRFDMSLDHNPSDTSAASRDASLLTAIAEGDEAAMAAFYFRHATRIYSVALRVLRNSNSAEEVLQDILMLIWRAPTVLVATHGSLAGWLAVVARNRAVDVIRKREPSEWVDDLLFPLHQHLAAEMEDSATRDRAKQIVATLPSEQQAALELAFFQGLTPSEIAEVTGASSGTVKTHIQVALQTLGRAVRA